MIPAELSSGVDLTQAILQPWKNELFDKKRLTLEVLRTDRIHPIISGNKYFKLKYHLQAAHQQAKTGVISMGGAYSNHLLATACICHSQKLKSVGIVRGEEPSIYSPTLQQVKQFGMELLFVTREVYQNKTQLEAHFQNQYPNYYWVNEGGQSHLGVKGAAEILQLLTLNDYTHILCAVGTGTMMAGLLNAATSGQLVCGIPVLKIADQKKNDLLNFLEEQSINRQFSIQYDFHEGGYAKKTPDLLSFMNELFRDHQLPSDFVYTGKLFKAIYTLSAKDFFPPGSKLLIIHSGGLQGNRSIPAGSLIFTHTIQKS